MWKKLKSGTLIAIPGFEGQHLIGQVLIPGMTFFIQVHSLWIANLSDCYKALASSVLLFGETTDGELCREKWVICGEAPCPINFYRPYRVVFSPEGLILCDFDNQTIRKADNVDFQKYGYKTSSSSPVLSEAVRNYFQKKSDAEFGHLDGSVVAKKCVLWA